MEPEEILALVERAGAGDERAWHAIVDEFAGVVWSTVRGFRLNEAQSSDAVQTTWLRLVEHLGAIRDPERLAGWLQTTARRICLQSLRESRREQLVADWDESLAGSSSRPDQHAAVPDDPETEVVRREQIAALRRALTTLPERDRVLLKLLTSSSVPGYHEISRRLAMPVGSIGPTRARALVRLRAALESSGVHAATPS